jgi:hypothetical protein|tara:strand:- start:1805 stop:3802 length:1998 start_codon:yes stop_codon:yes gene_type:complete
MAETDLTTPISRQAGDDQAIGTTEDGTSLTVLKAIQESKKEAEKARKGRLARNRENRRAYLGYQDFSHKQKGQSKEFLPQTPIAVEQFVGFIKRALTQFGAYYTIDLAKDSRSPLSGTTLRSLLNCFLDDLLVEDNKTLPFQTLLTDGIKVGALESLCILKIHGNMQTDRKFVVEQGDQIIGPDGIIEQDDSKLVAVDVKNWKLRVDLVQPENYLPDPTGAGLYEIHSTERDISYLDKRADEGVYDRAAVDRIKEDHRARPDDKRQGIDQGQDESRHPPFRRRVKIDEYWGTLLNGEGKILHENIFCAMANDKYLIRRPTPNPFWHQESPFVAVPLIRVPFSVWHKALFDHAVQLNFASNEMFNLILDGGISSVWGIKQLRTDDLEDPRQVADGIQQGDTLTVKNTLPHNAKVLETVSEGEVPRDAMAVLEMLERQFAKSALSSELKLGALPPKQVKATEVIELSQSQAVTLDAIIGDIERGLIAKTLRKCFLTIIQNMSDVASDRVIDAIGITAAFKLSRMSPAERFAVFAGGCSFHVNGLSAVLAKVRDFQKLMALLQAVITNPLMFQAFFKKYSPDKILAHIMKTLAINPENIERDADEMARLEADLQELPQFQALVGQGNNQGGGAGLSAQQVGEPNLPAEINAASNPTSSLAGAGNAGNR